jgi:NADH:ubiquinone oxidoreductase subunit C
MMQGLQSPQVIYSTTGTSNSSTMPSINAEIRMPYQNTPADVYKYLKEMDFIHTTSLSGDIWMRKGTTEYFTWEQAVVYCLIKPFLNHS